MNQNHEFSDIEDFHSNEFYSSYCDKFVELSYLRPDGSLKRYIFNPSLNADISVDYSKLKENLKCEGLTLAQNNELGQEIKHYHIHLIPRYPDDNADFQYDKDKTHEVEEVFNKLK